MNKIGFWRRAERFWLVLGFAIMLGLMALQTLLSLREIEQQRQQLKAIIENGLTKFDHVGRMHAAGRERMLLLQRMFLTADPFERESLREQFSQQAERFIQARQSLLVMPLQSEERALLERQSELSRRFHEIQLQMLDLLDLGEMQQATRLLDRALLPTQYAVLSILDQLYAVQQRNARQIARHSDRLQAEARRLLLTVAILVLFSGMSVAYYVFRRVRAASDERERLATHDLLTGLPNRVLIHSIVKQAIDGAQRHGRKLALMFVDLDRFKAVNDTLGHRAGDALLTEVAARLRKSVRASDTVGRLAGDEFVVLLEGISSTADALAVAEKIRRAVQQPMHIDGSAVQVGASIGIALYPEHGLTLESLLRAADMAMYQVKGGGRDGYRLADAQAVSA